MAGAWQNTLTLKVPSLAARTASIICLASSVVLEPTLIEPRPPALVTAAARAGVEIPAIGAWMIG